ncbi:heavy metal translocating P-type ATPase [Rehaibacterium terrae]|jgi:Cu2+-exporting ATPase|uniref:Cu2+-exporting ATPase n=1 Tax=Rehaibacterium terrae TaxID=1341696 RepID=A0A7W8DDH3_9GAMM|nr:heavy metal translocating P-type ATPase [Rehaibacterium terrae]MBB5015150.1 Cu2+-exporting ATPase [Rehaibacterium terrae]
MAREGGCFHCGEPLPADAPTVTLDGAPRAVCCHGCGTAAAWIRDAGLDDYYRLRQADGRRVDAEADDFAAWDRADILAEHSREAIGGREITVLVEGMRCAACAWLIDRALRRVDGVRDVQANAVTGRLIVAWDPDTTPLSRVLQALARLGYRPHLAPGEALERERRRERRTLLIRLGVAGLGMLQAMMFAEALYLDFDNQMPAATRDFFRWIAFLLATPVVFYSGWPFLAGMARELRLRRLGMDTLVATSVLLAYLASLIETLRGGPHVWIDAAVMFVFLLLAARAIEALARQRANAAVDTLARARPALAWRIGDDGRREQVPLAALTAGDTVRVGVGEQVPTDGVLCDDGEFDESLLTGESRPVAKRAGEPVYAGSTCRNAPVRMRVTRTGQDTRLSHLVRLVEQAQAQRPRLAQAADALASRFVVSLFATAAVVFAVWWHLAPERAFEVMLAVLVISCPCALSLAIPTALGVSHGALARIGVLALRPDALDTLARADTLVLDKTGTLTEGRPSLRHVETFAGMDAAQARRIAAALERDAGHPLARAFAGEAAPVADEVRAAPGQGIQGLVDGRCYRLGRADFAASRFDDGMIWLGDGTHALARFVIEDRPRADAVEAVAALKSLGLSPTVLSGDGVIAVGLLAGALGIPQHHARLSPEDKLAFVRSLQADGHVVAMVGDGINDAPVLAGADVSLAMAGGAPLAHRSADLVLTGESLLRLPQTVALARRTRAVIRQNLAWALAYNIIALPFAALGWVTPWLAALGMAGSSLLVTANALRLARLPFPARPEAGTAEARATAAAGDAMMAP